MRSFVAIGLLLACSLAFADGLADLKRTLAGLVGRQPIEAQLAFSHSQVNAGDAGKARAPLTVHAEVGADPNGVRLEFPRRTLDLAVAESRQTDPEAKKPVSAALSQILVTDVDEYLNAAPKLLAPLERAELISEKSEVWRGQPARVLALKLNPLLGKQERKYVKKLDASAKVWISADGVPLAAEQHYAYSGRAMLVINFESATHESFEFQKRGDRLVVVRHRREDTSSGGGESGTRTVDARMTVSSATAPAQTGTR